MKYRVLSREEVTIIHLLTECPAYEVAMDWAIGKYIEIIGEREFHMKRQDDDRGLSQCGVQQRDKSNLYTRTHIAVEGL